MITLKSDKTTGFIERVFLKCQVFLLIIFVKFLYLLNVWFPGASSSGCYYYPLLQVWKLKQRRSDLVLGDLARERRSQDLNPSFRGLWSPSSDTTLCLENHLFSISWAGVAGSIFLPFRPGIGPWLRDRPTAQVRHKCHLLATVICSGMGM